MQLSQATITQASIEILNEFGLGDMTMRRLATRLKVAPGALYWHFENKQALIAATARHIVQPLLSDADDTPDSPTDFLARCTQFRTCLWQHRDGGELLSAALLNDELREELLDYLQGGFAATDDPEFSATAANTALYFIVGSTVVAQTQAQLVAANTASASQAHENPASAEAPADPASTTPNAPDSTAADSPGDNTAHTKPQLQNHINPLYAAANTQDPHFFQGIELIIAGMQQKRR